MATLTAYISSMCTCLCVCDDNMHKLKGETFSSESVFARHLNTYTKCVHSVKLFEFSVHIDGGIERVLSIVIYIL